MSTNKKGRLMIWCDNCQAYYLMNDGQYTGVCEHCGSMMTRMRCTRCGHQWSLKDFPKMPKVCADDGCKSPYWNRERILNRKGKLVPYDEKD